MRKTTIGVLVVIPKKGGIILIEKDDWRLMGQEKVLLGIELIHRTYKAPRPSWDHDHCEFCWFKLMTEDQWGYCTTDEKQRWICEECFEDFKEMFQWKVVK